MCAHFIVYVLFLATYIPYSISLSVYMYYNYLASEEKQDL